MKKFLLFVSITCMAHLLQAQNLQPWKLQLGAGTTYTITSDMQTNLTQNMMGQEMKIGSGITTTAQLQVVAVAATGFNVAQTTNRMQMLMKMNTPMGEQDMTFDSDKKEDREGEIGQRLGTLIGATMEAFIAPDAKVTITKPLELDEALNIPGMGTGANDSLALRSIFLLPPPKALQVGDSWKESSNTESMKSDITYRYLRSEGGIAHFQYEQSVTTNQTISTNGMEVQTSQTVTGTGTVQVELASGLVLQRNFEGKLSGKSEVMGMEIPQEGTQKITQTLKKN